MTSRRASFVQSDLTKVLKAFKDSGLPTPTIVIEPQRIIVSPKNRDGETDLSKWDNL